MVRHYIVTNRKILNEKTDNEEIYKLGDEEARDEFRLAYYDFDPDKLEDNGKITLIPDAKNHLTSFLKKYYPDSNENIFGSSIMFTEVYSKMSELSKHDALIFTHGFDNNLDDSLKKMRALYKKFVEPQDSPIEILILFTWPSMKNILKYRDDARDAQETGYAMGRAYQKLLDFYKTIFKENNNASCNNKIHLLFHSMGNRVAESMIKELVDEKKPLCNVFGEIILAAADIDFDCFEKPNAMNYLINICKRVHIYYNYNDKALFVSETTKNAFKRLGREGPRKISELPDNVFAYNVTGKDNDSKKSLGIDIETHHGYFYESQTIVNDIKKILNGEKSGFN
jgi:esterase/lipase superfamily enzyme